jgi:hypothetical protein
VTAECCLAAIDYADELFSVSRCGFIAATIMLPVQIHVAGIIITQ